MDFLELMRLLVGITVLGAVLLGGIGVATKSVSFRWWGAAYCAVGSGIWLAMVRDLNPLVANLGKALVILAFGLMAVGLRSLSGRPGWGCLWYGVPALAWLLLAGLTDVLSPLGMPIAILGLFFDLGIVLVARELLRLEGSYAARVPLLIVMGLHGLFYFVRFCAIIFYDRSLETLYDWLRWTAMEGIFYTYCDTLLLMSLVRSRQAHLLRMAAETDFLTGVFNRRGFTRAVKGRIGREGGAMLALDLDGLKAVNDRLGHARGDDLLQDLCRILRESTRGSDVIGRFGGDEFVIFVAGKQAEAPAVAHRIRSAFQRLGADYGLPVGVSVGMTKIGAGESDLSELLKRADADLSAAKTARYKFRVAVA